MWVGAETFPESPAPTLSVVPAVQVEYISVRDNEKESLEAGSSPSGGGGKRRVPKTFRSANRDFISNAILALDHKASTRSLAEEITHSRSFTFLMGIVISINAVYLGIETDYARDDDSGSWFAIEVSFTTIFLVELILRLFAERCAFWRDSWNIFDTFLVGTACIDTFLIEILLQRSGGEAVELLSIMKIFRVLRVARVLRLLRFFKKLWLLVIGVMDAMLALFWAWLLIALIIYVFSIFLTRTLGKVFQSENQDIKDQFGTVVKTMFTMFQVMTLDDWPAIARNAMHYEPWIWIIFILFLVITTFSIMNVIVAVIVESTLDQAMNHKAEEVKQQEIATQAAGRKVRQVFKATDANRDGRVTREEFIAALKRTEVYAYLQDAGIDVRQAENLFDILDYDDSGFLDAEEFTSGVLKARGQAKAKDVLNVQCNILKYEQQVHKRLEDLCRAVDSRMARVDEDVVGLHKDLDTIRQSLIAVREDG
mmetsp:Transcript_21916/g.46579  ORF Transcript_21916/g.46579 Transcript_21916/m.46579 type:complete len:482 (+) Transcript_21916:127-1572(+)